MVGVLEGWLRRRVRVRGAGREGGKEVYSEVLKSSGTLIERRPSRVFCVSLRFLRSSLSQTFDVLSFLSRRSDQFPPMFSFFRRYYLREKETFETDLNSIIRFQLLFTTSIFSQPRSISIVTKRQTKALFDLTVMY